jgi:hypothetical protein
MMTTPSSHTFTPSFTCMKKVYVSEKAGST